MSTGLYAMYMCCLVLGLDDIIGNFEVGKEFDALLIEPGVTRSKFVVVSSFDTVQVLLVMLIIIPGSKKPLFCVPTDELLRAKDDLLSEGGQSLNSVFADCFGDWFIGIPFVGDDVVAKCISKLH